MKIFTYVIPTQGPQLGIVILPVYAKVLSIQLKSAAVQFGEASIYGNDYVHAVDENVLLWAMVNENEYRNEQRKFAFISTGSSIMYDELQRGVYITTLQFAESNETYHIFDMGAF